MITFRNGEFVKDDTLKRPRHPNPFIDFCWSMKGKSLIRHIKDEDGQYHSDDGPAIMNGERIAWYKHGKLHRIDGPAEILKNGKCAYYVNGHNIRNWLVENKIDLTNLTEDDITLIKLTWI